MRFEFPPRSSGGSILGFTWSQITAVVAGLILLVTALNLTMAHRTALAISCVVVATVLFTVGLLRIRGRRAIEWAPIFLAALAQSTVKQDRYRGMVFAPNSLTAHMDLPGVLAGYTWLPAMAPDGRTEIGLLAHRSEHTITAVLRCAGSNFVLADTATQQQRLSDWRAVLNSLGLEYAERGLVAWQLLTRSIPDTGNPAQRHLIHRAVDTSSAAYRSLAELTAAAAPTAQRQETYLAVVFDRARMRDAIRAVGDTDAAAAALVVEQLFGIAQSVGESGVTARGWLSPRELAAVFRTQFDPAEQPHVDLHTTTRSDGAPAGVDARLAGPAATEQVGWLYYRHDSAISQTLWVHQMPRQPLPGTWAAPLFTQATGRRAVSLIAQPVPAQLASLASRRERVSRAGEQLTKSKLGLLLTAAERNEAAAAETIDAEQAAGHVRYRYTLLITVTAETIERLERDVLRVKHLLARCGMEAVLLTGEQDQGFAAAALPLARGLKPLRGWLT